MELLIWLTGRCFNYFDARSFINSFWRQKMRSWILFRLHLNLLGLVEERDSNGLIPNLAFILRLASIFLSFNIYIQRLLLLDCFSMLDTVAILWSSRFFLTNLYSSYIGLLEKADLLFFRNLMCYHHKDRALTSISRSNLGSISVSLTLYRLVFL